MGGKTYVKYITFARWEGSKLISLKTKTQNYDPCNEYVLRNLEGDAVNCQRLIQTFHIGF